MPGELTTQPTGLPLRIELFGVKGPNTALLCLCNALEHVPAYVYDKFVVTQNLETHERVTRFCKYFR